MTTCNEHRLVGAAGEPLAASVFPAAEARGWIVFCHGFKGFRRWGGWDWMASRWQEAGFTTITFDFSHCGTSPETPTEFSRLDLFERNSWGKELDDLATVVGAARNGELGDTALPGRPVLVGHSKGGGVVLLSGDHLDAAGVVGLAAVGRANRLDERAVAEIRERGYTEIENARTGQLMRVGRAFLDDLEASADRYDIEKVVAAGSRPILLVHGVEDPVVPVAEAEAIRAAAGGRAGWLPIPGTGHTFGVGHPFAAPTTEFERVVDAVVEFAGQVVGA